MASSGPFGQDGGPRAASPGCDSSIPVPAGGGVVENAPLLGTNLDLVSLHLMLRPADGERGLDTLALPFVVLSQEGLSSRVLKAGLFDRNDALIAPCALKIQHIRSVQTAGGSQGSDQTNGSHDAAWRRRIEAAQQYAASRNGAPRLIAVGDVVEEGGHRRFGPRLFCKTRRVFFRPRSPISYAPLENCRNEALLARHGLPQYGSSTVRFLYSPQDAQQGKTRFYTDSAVPTHVPEELVGNEEDCFRDQGKVVAARQHLSESQPDLHRQLRCEFPCYECSEASTCYPDDGYARVLDRVIALSFHDFFALCYELYDMQLDDFCDLVAGRPIQPWIDELRRAPHASAKVHLCGPLQRMAAAPRWFVYDGETSGRSVLESLVLKWSALTHTLDRLCSLYRDCRRPHLNLSSGHVVVRLAHRSPGNPLLWGFEVGLVGLDGATVVEVPDGTGTGTQHAAKFGRRSRGMFHITEVRSIPEHAGAVRVRGRFTDPTLGPAVISGGDMLRMHLPARNGHRRFAVWCRLERDGLDESPAVAGEVRDEEAAADLVLYEGKTLDGIHCEFFPKVGLADDLRALGILLLRTLLVNRQQSLSRLAAEASAILADPQLPDDPARAEEWLDGTIRTLVASAKWAAHNVLYEAGSKGKAAAGLVPMPEWSRILGMLFGMLGSTAPFGLARDLVDHDHAIRVLEDLLDRCLAIQRCLERELFGPGTSAPDAAQVIQLLAKRAKT